MTAAADLWAHLQSLEERLLAPDVRLDPDALDALLSDDFREFGSSGKVYSKAEVIHMLTSSAPRRITLTDLECYPLNADVALVTYRSLHHEGSGTPTEALRASIWIKQSGAWRLRFHQGTRV